MYTISVQMATTIILLLPIKIIYTIQNTSNLSFMSFFHQLSFQVKAASIPLSISNLQLLFLKHYYVHLTTRTLFLFYIFWHVQIMKNHVFCYTFSCVNVCELQMCHLFHLFIRYLMYCILY